MPRYEVVTVHRDGKSLMLLKDLHRGAEALVWPALGFNCLAARLPAPDGRLVNLILEPEALDQVRAQPSWWGVPLLFPWPGRIPGGEYRFEGKRYRLPTLDAAGNAIHGFVRDRPWRVAHVAATDADAAISAVFASTDHPATLDGYPFPYAVRATYRLSSTGLGLSVEVENTGDGPMPFGFGAHPYFRLPLSPTSSLTACQAAVPARRRWDLARLGQLPLDDPQPRAGRLLDDLAVPVFGNLDLRRPRPLRQHYDGGFTGLCATNARVECYVRDPEAELDAVMAASDNFRTVVVYTPPGRPAICLEPWTCPPNAFNLAACGVKNAGVIVLAPGEHWAGSMHLCVREARAAQR